MSTVATQVAMSGIMGQGSERDPVASLLEILGNGAILLPIPYGEKGPIIEGWQNTSSKQMADPAYLGQFGSPTNIGVLLGKPSGGICSIDVDADVDVGKFLEANPRLKDTLRTRGKRGCNIWVRVSGEYPKLKPLRTQTGEKWGEWRADGGQTVIQGRHPSGCDYSILRNTKPVEISFDEIAWPDDLVIPWKKNLTDTVIEKYGRPFVVGERGMVMGLNEQYWGGLFLAENLILHEPGEREFYQYEDATGLWRPVTTEVLIEKISTRLFQYRMESDAAEVEKLIKQSRVKPIVETLRGQAEKQDAFISKPRIIHFANGVVRFKDTDIQFGGFSHEDFSRNQSPIAFDESAQCPRFLSELMKPAVNADDLDLIQKWFGLALYGVNLPQRILILTGTAGGGKSTLASIVEALVGRANCYQLRTENLAERFEIFRYRRKTLLVGADVPGDFLTHRGASTLKSLVGGDMLSAEGKGSNGDFQIHGNLNVLITCNSRLRVRLEGDTAAWRRRLLIVNYENQPPVRKIVNFADLMVQQEGAGIARWALAGFIKAMAEFYLAGDFKLTQAQLARVDGLLAESESVEHFLKATVAKVVEGDITSAEMTEAYSEYCAEMGWTAAPITVVQNQLTDLLLRLFQTSKRNDLKRGERNQRGWSGVSLNV